MEIIKSFECTCTFEKVQGVSKKGKEYTAYRFSCPEINIAPIFIDVYNKNGAKLAYAIDLLGDPPASDK